ncbi:hypothetical protein JOD52_003248 [Brachybacterium muris]|nr:hypothetical protein [Brachybacterium muris]MBM7502408.1 hypothetical protein [Brachybacterium muris]
MARAHQQGLSAEVVDLLAKAWDEVPESTRWRGDVLGDHVRGLAR